MMVYGLNVKPEWGFDPKVSWEGQEAPRPIPALNPVNDGGVNGDGYFAGLPVDGTNFPKWVRWSDPNGNPVPDFDRVPFLSVSEKAKGVIESLEPGVHQFFPVEYQDKDGNFTETRYWFVPCNRIDSVDHDHTTMVLGKFGYWRPVQDLVRRGEPLPPNADPTKPSKYVFNRRQIGDRHIWRDKHIGNSVWLSDQAAARFKSEGLTGVRFSENGMETV